MLFRSHILLGRALFASGHHQEVVEISDAAIRASGNDYNIYVPIRNALSALGKTEAFRNMNIQAVQALEAHLREVPEDARARCHLALAYIALNRLDDANREANLAMALRPNDAMVAYNLACVFCRLNRKEDGMKTLRKAWEAGFHDTDWARNDPDLDLVHGDPEFERLYPPPQSSGPSGP